MYVNGNLELIGTLNNVNLEDYVTFNSLNIALNSKVDKSEFSNLSTVVSNL